MDTLAIKDYEAAVNWNTNVAALNQKKKEYTEQVSTIMKDVADMSAGDMVDDLTNFGTKVLETGNVVFEAMEEIETTVMNLMKAADEFVEGFKTSVKTNLVKLFN